MATGLRKRHDFQRGDIGAPLAVDGLTLTFTVAPGFTTLATNEYIPIVLSEGTAREIVHLTAYTAGATTGTIERAQEGTTASPFTTAGKWHHGVTAQDMNLAVASGDVDFIDKVTQAEYDAIATKDPRTLYIIEG